MKYILTLCPLAFEILRDIKNIAIDVIDVAAVVLQVYFLVLHGIVAFSFDLLSPILHFLN